MKLYQAAWLAGLCVCLTAGAATLGRPSEYGDPRMACFVSRDRPTLRKLCASKLPDLQPRLDAAYEVWKQRNQTRLGELERACQGAAARDGFVAWQYWASVGRSAQRYSDAEELVGLGWLNSTCERYINDATSGRLDIPEVFIKALEEGDGPPVPGAIVRPPAPAAVRAVPSGRAIMQGVPAEAAQASAPR